MLSSLATTFRRDRLAGWGALLLGGALGAAYVAILATLCNGRAEFGYAPFTPEPLPYSPARGFTFEQLWSHIYRAALLGPALIAISFGVSRVAPKYRWTISPQKFAAWATAASVAAVAFVMLGVLRGRPINTDELVYRMQAEFLSEGRLVGRDVGFVPIVDEVFSIVVRGGYTGKYLPGEAIVQVPGVLAGIPALLHVPFTLISVLAFWKAVSLRGGPDVGALAAVFLALSPTFVLTSATGLSHAPALACICVAALAGEWIRGARPRLGAALFAAAISFGVAVRPQSVVPAGAVLFVSIGIDLWRHRDGAAAAILFSVAALGITLLGAYNRALTGSALRLPWFLDCPSEHYGFGQVWQLNAYRHTFRHAIENLCVVAVRLNAWWLGLPLGLLLLVVWVRLGRPRAGAARWLWMGGAIVAFEFPYYSTGQSDTGSAYHFELVLPGAVIAANVVSEALRRWPRAASGVLITHLVLGTGAFFVEQIARLDRLVTAIHHDADEVLGSLPKPALLLTEVWPSEGLQVGWVSAAFPERFRAERDPVITYPRPPPARLDRLLAAYPGRSCWYFHRDPMTARVELKRCDQARSELARPLVDPELRLGLWIPPTAFKVTSFDPRGAVRRELHEIFEKKRAPCCAVDRLKLLDLAWSSGWTCVPE